MIKLIASDMDGTLLDDNGNLPKDFFEIIKRLEKQDVKFVVASGRSYSTLYENFKPISDELYFICDNGAFIVENGEVCSISILDKEKVKLLIDACSKISNIHILLCGIKSTYHLPVPEIFAQEIKKYYIKTTEVNNLSSVDDDIFKIAICDSGVPSDNSYNILKSKFNDDFMIVISGKHWLDIANLGINKGSALASIQERDGISFDETMVFGDYYNDISMLSKAHYSFVMENALEDMKQYGNYIAKSNIENGVIDTINQYVLN